MRSLAIKKGYKLNEYGLFKKDNEKYVVGKNEDEIYKKLGLSYIDPELRENRGEIEVASKNKLPKLVKYEDINGDFHIHSNWSDGFESIEKIARYCKKIGYKYVCIADHSQSLYVARGLSEDRLIKKKNEIDKINKKLDGFRILFGTECDIKSDGKMDYSNKILQQFDFVHAAIHTAFKMKPEQATKRVLQGMENEYVHCLAHPTCRIIGRREPFELDIEKVIDAAKETDTFLEINAFPDRLDLNDIHTKLAKEKNVKIVIGTDAHYMDHLMFMRYGVATGRRGWLEKKDILNTYSLNEIEKVLGLQ
jgi:DNA polymerase (family 10)